MSGLGKTFESNFKTRPRQATIDTSTDEQLNPTRRGAGIKSWFSDYYNFQDQSTSILLLTVTFSSQLNPRKCTERSAYLDLALIFLLFLFSLLILFFLHLALIALFHLSCRSESSNKSLSQRRKFPEWTFKSANTF